MQEKEKQIEEMRYLADEMAKAISTEYEKRVLADERKLEEVLKANGWRKASDVAEEIFAEIENALELLRISVKEGRKNDGIKYQQLHDGRILSIEAIKYFTAELKKKYTEEGK